LNIFESIDIELAIKLKVKILENNNHSFNQLAMFKYNINKVK